MTDKIDLPEIIWKTIIDTEMKETGYSKTKEIYENLLKGDSLKDETDMDLNTIVKELKTTYINTENFKKNKFSHSIYVTIISLKSQFKGLEGTVKNYYPSNLVLTDYTMIYVEQNVYQPRVNDKILRIIPAQSIPVTKLSDGKFKTNKHNLTIDYNPNAVQLLIRRQKTIPIKEKNVKLLENNTKAKVLKGPYANKILQVSYYKPSYLQIVLQNGLIIDNIEPSDVFYKDFLLNSGEYAQMISFDKTNSDLLNVKVKRASNIFEDITISKSFINEFLPGMSLISKNKVSEITNAEFINDDEQEYLESYNDSNKIDTLLSKEEKYVKSSVQTILTALDVNENMIEFSVLQNNLNIILNSIKESGLYKDDIYNSPNIKYLIICLVLYKYIESPFNRLNLDTVIQSLYLTYIKKSDLGNESLNDTIFINKSNNSVVNAIKTYIKTKNFLAILKVLIENTHSYINSVLNNNLSLDNLGVLGISELIPLGRKRKRSLKVLSVKDLFSKQLPSKEVSIMWGKFNLEIIENFKTKLDTIISSQENKEMRKYLTTVKNNLYRAPFAIRDDKLPLKIKTYFQQLYDSLLSTILTVNPQYKDSSVDDMDIEIDLEEKIANLDIETENKKVKSVY